jgi:hypothetical protein
MKTCAVVAAAAILTAWTASAQEPGPRYEVYLGFQYVRANQFNQNFGLGQSIGGFDMYGGDGQFIYNFNHWASFVVDAGGVNKPNIGIPGVALGVADTTAFVYGGPRFYYRRHHHGIFGLTPFGEILFGDAFRHLSTDVTAITSFDTPSVPIATPYGTLFPGPLAVVNGALKNTENAFSMKVGGGLDYRFNKHIGFRPLEVDYVLTRFPSFFTGVRANQSSIAASAGLVFTFGAL